MSKSVDRIIFDEIEEAIRLRAENAALRAVLREYADTYSSKIFMCKDLEDRARALLGEK